MRASGLASVRLSEIGLLTQPKLFTEVLPISPTVSSDHYMFGSASGLNDRQFCQFEYLLKHRT